ncbi:MAG: metallophosphoesterase [Thermodesulfobacteriota bacterium]
MGRRIFGRKRSAKEIGLKIFLVGMLAAVAGFEIFAVLAERESRRPLPPHFGNFTRIQDSLEKAEPKEEFSFAVFGDTEGGSPYALLAKKLRQEPVDFAVHLGDAFDARTYPHFRYMMQKKLAMPFPVFFVQGNQDVKALPLDRFEENFGPSLFSFVYQNCLFIGLRVQGEGSSTLASQQYLERVLRQAGNSYRRIFVFQHVPPQVLPNYKFAAPKSFERLFVDFEVDYVFSGHYHGDAHVKKGATAYIVTGTAGKHLDENPYGQFQHGLLITVGQDFVSKKIIPLQVGYRVDDRLQRFAIVELYPWLLENRPLAATLNLLLLVVIVGTLKSLLHRNR